MKHILLFFIGAVYFIPCRSQDINSQLMVDYDSVMVETKIWSVLTGGYGAGNVEIDYQTTFVKFVQNTASNSVTEKKVMISTDSLKSWTTAGNIIESDKKVYYCDTSGNQGLLYDFSASEGSTIKIVNYFSNGSIYSDDNDTIKVTVENIDTVNYLGEDRLRFDIYSGGLCIDYWIEGIGSTKGILYSCVVWDGSFRELLCVHNSNSLIYENTERDVCYMDSTNEKSNDTTSKVKVQTDQQIIIYPNPANDVVYFDYSDNIFNDLSFNIFNSLGELVTSSNLKSKKISLNLETGLYFIRIMEKEKLVFNSKLLINNQ